MVMKRIYIIRDLKEKRRELAVPPIGINQEDMKRASDKNADVFVRGSKLDERPRNRIIADQV